MSTSLKPWTKAAFELIIHAELHLRDGGDFDRRMAHIGFDNAIEVAITTYLNLHPIQRGNRIYKREDINRWMSNYHTKLEFLQEEASAQGWSLRVPNDEVAFYHDIRNGQYHAGGPGIPESDHLAALRIASLDTFAMLFNVSDVEQVLEDHLQQRLLAADGRPPRDATVDYLLDTADEPQVVILGQFYSASEALYATDPDAYGAIAAAVAESRNVLNELRSKYKDCVRETIHHIGFVHYEQSVYMKTIDADGHIDLTDTDFIAGNDNGNLFFPNTHSPDQNADLLVQQFDPFSMINCFDLFTDEAAERISEAHQLGTLESLFGPNQEGGAVN